MTDPFSQFMAGGDLPASALSWLLDSFATPFLKAIGGKWQDSRERARWDDALRSYGQSILRHYGRLRVLGKSEDVPLGDVFTDVHILDQISARRRFDMRELMEKQVERFDLPQHTGERRNGMGLVNQGQSLYILGKPGAGKTTFLKNVAVASISNRLGSPTKKRLPLFVPLHEWANSRHHELLPFLVDQLDVHHFPEADKFLEHLLENGNGQILFDGLDEVRQEREQRAHLAQQLRDFTKKYDKNQTLITCRVAASEYAFSGLRDVEMADFTREQSLDYACKWFGDAEQKYESFAADLEKPENAGLAELCNVPLLLSLLCLYYDDAQSFPPRRAELYEDALDALLRKWDSSRQIQRDKIYEKLSHKRKQQMFAHIATPAFEKGQLYWTTKQLAYAISSYLSNLPGAPPLEEIDGEAILYAIEAQHGVLVERAHNIHSFSHLSFQEYFTARYIVENEARGTIHRLIDNHLIDVRWREVILLSGSLLDNADELMSEIRRTTSEHIDDRWFIYLDWLGEKIQQERVSEATQLSVLRIAYLILVLDYSLSKIRTQFFELPDRKNSNTQIDHKYWAKALLHLRRQALNLAFILDANFANALDLTLALALDIAVPLTSNVDIDIILTPDLARSRSINISEIFAFIYTRIRSIVNSTTQKTGVHFLLFCIWRISGILQSNSQLNDARYIFLRDFVEIQTFCTEFGEEDATALINFNLPVSIRDEVGWYGLTKALGKNLGDIMHMPELLLTPHISENSAMDRYLYANELLVRCLDLAYVTNRQEILDNLLRPPG